MEISIKIPTNDLNFLSYAIKSAESTFFSAFSILDKSEQKDLIAAFYLQRVLTVFSQDLQTTINYDIQAKRFYIAKKYTVKILPEIAIFNSRINPLPKKYNCSVNVLSFHNYKIVGDCLHFTVTTHNVKNQIKRKLAIWALQEGYSNVTFEFDKPGKLYSDQLLILINEFEFENQPEFNMVDKNSEDNLVRDFLDFLNSLKLSIISAQEFEDLRAINKSACLFFPDYCILDDSKKLEILFKIIIRLGKQCHRLYMAEYLIQFLIKENCINTLYIHNFETHSGKMYNLGFSKLEKSIFSGFYCGWINYKPDHILCIPKSPYSYAGKNFDLTSLRNLIYYNKI